VRAFQAAEATRSFFACLLVGAPRLPIAIEVRQLLIDFWLGHDNPDMSSRYAKRPTEDMEFRQDWTKRVGLGFELKGLLESESGVNCATCAAEIVEHVCVANA
jgi:hypothetical protein